MIVYFDTSALIKLVFEEPGSPLAGELWERAASVISSQLVYPEARAAVACAHRGGRIDEPMLRRSLKTVDDLYAALDVVAVDESLALTAGRLAEHHGLRGYDAVHLASALAVGSDTLLFATWDHDLADAAGAAGCLVTTA